MAKMTLTPEQLSELIAEQIKASIKELGLDNVDKKFGVAPTKEDPNGDAMKDMQPEERVAAFFKALVMRDDTTVKALSAGVDAAGGFLVPDEFKNMLIEAIPDYTVMRPLVTVIPVSVLSGTIPAITGKPGAEWGAENTAMNEQTAAFGEVRYTLNRLQSLIPMSRELLADARIEMSQLITRLFAEAFAGEEDRAITAGSGTGQPKGFTTETLGSVAQSGVSLSLDDLVTLKSLLPAQYRRRASFMTSSAGMELLGKLKDGNGLPLLYTPADSDVSTLFGKPVIENTNIAEDLGDSSNETEIYFGDFNYYYLFDRGEYAVESTMDGYGAFEKHQVVMKAFNRLDGKVGLTDGIVKLTGVK